MTKDEAINHIKSANKIQGGECHLNCRLSMNALLGQYCLLNKEELYWHYDEVTKKDIFERTETCKALFKEGKMNGILHICIANAQFQCPYCGAEYNDENEKYLNRINNNQLNFTKTQCSCGQKFGITYNQMGNAVAFKLEKNNEI